MNRRQFFLKSAIASIVAPFVAKAATEIKPSVIPSSSVAERLAVKPTHTSYAVDHGLLTQEWCTANGFILVNSPAFMSYSIVQEDEHTQKLVNTPYCCRMYKVRKSGTNYSESHKLATIAEFCHRLGLTHLMRARACPIPPHHDRGWYYDEGLMVSGARVPNSFEARSFKQTA